MKTTTHNNTHTLWSILIAVVLILGSASLVMAQTPPGGTPTPVIHGGAAPQQIESGKTLYITGSPANKAGRDIPHAKGGALVVKDGLLGIAGTFSPKKLNIGTTSGSHTVNVGEDVYSYEFDEYDTDGLKLCVDSTGVVIPCPSQ